MICTVDTCFGRFQTFRHTRPRTPARFVARLAVDGPAQCLSTRCRTGTTMSAFIVTARFTGSAYTDWSSRHGKGHVRRVSMGSTRTMTKTTTLSEISTGVLPSRTLRTASAITAIRGRGGHNVSMVMTSTRVTPTGVQTVKDVAVKSVCTIGMQLDGVFR